MESYAKRPTAWTVGLVGALLVMASVIVVSRAQASTPVFTFGTLTVTDIGTTSASVSGSVNPGGTDTTAWFTYAVKSTNPPAGSTTPVQDVGAGTTVVPVSAGLTGLAQNTRYYVWLVATNATGATGWTEPVPFTTAGSPTTVSPTTPRITTMTMRDTRPGLNLTAVTCPTASRCWATGNDVVSPTSATAVILSMSGGVWSAAPVIAPGFGDLSGIDCPSLTSCWSVGGVSTASGEAPGALHYNGRSWLRVSMPTPSSFGVNYLNALACPSAMSCWAVGGREGATSLGRALVEHYDGRTWSIVPSPGPSGDSFLAAVSCTSTRSCWAVGTSNDAGPVSQIGSLIEHYNGHSWSQVGAPTVPSGLHGVSCRWSASCFTNGLQLRSGTWRRVSGFGNAQSLGCLNATSCWGVDYNGSAQFWNGTSWSLVSGPSLAPGRALALDSIACSAGGPCVAVGSEGAGTSAGGAAPGAMYKVRGFAELLGIGPP